MGSIELKNVRKDFGAISVINDVSFKVNGGEFTVFVGPSGCGKCTLLRLIAGLEDISSGNILIDEKVNKAAAILNRTDYLDRRPRQLSGGQRQRVAIGRAIVREPAAFLFDEPLSNLDAALRVQMRLEIGDLHNNLKTTMIYVTHDQVEAMTMADKIVVLNKGAVAQIGSPLELYNKPNGLFVARFIGSPTMNIVSGPAAAKRNAASIGIRPEHVDFSTSAGEWPGKVRIAEHLGADTFVYVDSDAVGPLTVRLEGEAPVKPGQTVYVTPQENRLHRFDRDGKSMA